MLWAHHSTSKLETKANTCHGPITFLQNPFTSEELYSQANLRRYGVPHQVESFNSITIICFEKRLNSIILSEYRSLQIARR